MFPIRLQELSIILNFVLTYNNLSLSYTSFVMSLPSHVEPNTLKLWTMTAEEKLYNVRYLLWSQIKNRRLFFCLRKKTTIGWKWVFKIKYKVNGTVERYKSRLVAKEYTQIEDIDYFDTLSPITKMVTIRLFLYLASIYNWELKQLGINNAFLHGELKKHVYMVASPWLTSIQLGWVCKLKKVLYWLKQASREWFVKLSSFFFAFSGIYSI